MWTHGVANTYMAIFPVLVLASVNQYLYWIFCCVLPAVAVAVVITLVRGPSRRSRPGVPQRTAPNKAHGADAASQSLT